MENGSIWFQKFYRSGQENGEELWLFRLESTKEIFYDGRPIVGKAKWIRQYNRYGAIIDENFTSRKKKVFTKYKRLYSQKFDLLVNVFLISDLSATVYNC